MSDKSNTAVVQHGFSLEETFERQQLRRLTERSSWCACDDPMIMIFHPEAFRRGLGRVLCVERSSTCHTSRVPRHPPHEHLPLQKLRRCPPLLHSCCTDYCSAIWDFGVHGRRSQDHELDSTVVNLQVHTSYLSAYFGALFALSTSSSLKDFD